MNFTLFKTLSAVFPELRNYSADISYPALLDVMSGLGWEICVEHFVLPSNMDKPIKQYRYKIKGVVSAIDGPCDTYEQAFDEALLTVASFQKNLKEDSKLKD